MKRVEGCKMTVALILAGGIKSELATHQQVIVEDALIRIANRYMVEYVVDALQGSPYIEKVIIAGPLQQLEKVYAKSTFVQITANGKTTVQSFLNAYQLVAPEYEQLLVVTSDLPLLTTEAVNHFLETCQGLEGDFFYPIVSREVNENKYPGVERTYVHLKEGLFTGGNLLLVKSEVVDRCIFEAEELIRLRKKPLSLAAHLGWKLLFFYLLRRLSIEDAEKELSRLLGGVKGVGVISPYPEIGIDVDKPSDLAFVEKVLCS
ncbi:MAG: NTP transferase domain-containing protein [Clostridia bacterium]|jgi:GTP:adenosylcobinamide-phosphate guanylyltransferase|nr:NTP transferase domain-containing protein [Clostridia bacterium]